MQELLGALAERLGEPAPRKDWPADTCLPASHRWRATVSQEAGRWRLHWSKGCGSEKDGCAPPTKDVNHHGEISVDDPKLSNEARAWMAEHPDEKLPPHLCPTHGDCNTCPERKDCKWHSDGPPVDIEDMLMG